MNASRAGLESLERNTDSMICWVGRNVEKRGGFYNNVFQQEKKRLYENYAFFTVYRSKLCTREIQETPRPGSSISCNIPNQA